MRNFLAVTAFALGALTAVAGQADDKKKAPTLGDKVAAFAAEHKGKKVGSGQCADLATAALKAAGAKGRGKDDPNPEDYTWGELVFTLERTPKTAPQPIGKAADLKPGDVIQFRDTKWVTRSGNRISMRMAPHHTVVIGKVLEKGAVLKIYEQNADGKLEVAESTLRLASLTEGWIRVYRPQPKEEEK